MRSLEWLNAASEDDFVSALANMFEHSPWIPRAAFNRAPFASLAELHDALMQALSEMSVERRVPFLRAHPDLANKMQRAEGLTADSEAEQDGAGLDRLSNEELFLFHKMNRAYQAKFGFPFILCVRRNTKDSILDAFARRLEHSHQEEQETAFSEIRYIAALRLAQLVSAQDTLPVHGELALQVIDAENGRPAGDVSVELIELSLRGEDRKIAAITTNATGGADQALIRGRPLPIGVYEIRIDAGEYLRRQDAAVPATARLEVIPIRLRILVPESQLQIVLRIAPSGYVVSGIV